jgi:hypothetical protein
MNTPTVSLNSTQPGDYVIEWSYPTSANADRFGFHNGCYTVELVLDDRYQKALYGFATELEAQACVAELDEAYALRYGN